MTTSRGELKRTLGLSQLIFAIITIALASIGVSIWTSTRMDWLNLLFSLVNMGALCAFVLLHASVIGYYLIHQKACIRGTWFAHDLVPALAIPV